MFRLRFLKGLCLLVLLGSTAQSASGQAASPSISILNVDDSQFPELTLRLKVADGQGRPVEGLAAGDIVVFEDGAAAAVLSVADVTGADHGIAIVLVIDVSGSMAGSPLANAQAAAVNFLDGLTPIDQVAVLSFSNAVSTVLPLTDDIEAAMAAVESLTAGGDTALYDAAYQGVQAALQSELGEQIVILLGDGEESGVSLASPDDAFEAARAGGIAIHTISLGAAAEAPYFQQLSGLTGGVALGAPSPDQLAELWDELSSLLRRQVEVVVRSHVPGDGESHDLTVRATVGGSPVEATATFTSRAVTPTIELDGLAEDEAIASETQVRADVQSQGETASVRFSLDGEQLAALDSPPWRITLDPQTMRSGSHTLEVAATDESGVTGSESLTFRAAPLPPQVSIGLDEGDLLESARSITVEIISQAPVDEVVISVDGVALETLTDAPYRFVLDPETVGEGAHILSVAATDVDGQTGAAEVGFTAQPPAAVAAPTEPATGATSPLLPGIVASAAVVLLGLIAVLLLRQRTREALPGSELYLEMAAGLRVGERYDVTPEPQLIGRVSTAAILLPDPTGQLKISREHARVWREGDEAYIEDAGSTHGAFVDGVRIESKTLLEDGARIRLGGVELLFHGLPSAADDLRATALAPEPGVSTAREATPLSEEPPTPGEEESRTTRVKAPADSADEELRETKAKPPPKAADQDDEGETRRTRTKP